MAEGVAALNYRSVPDARPPLAMDVRIRLSVMMFLQFAVWGGWFTVFGVYCDRTLHFDKFQIGSLYGTMALGAIVSMMVAGQLADRVLSSEYLMAIFHLAGAALLYGMASVHRFESLWWMALAYALVYNPTLAIANSLAFANIPDATRDFPTLRVLGTLGWIAAGLSVDHLLPAGAFATNQPLLMCAGISAALGVLSLALPHTPPSGKKAGALPFLEAFGLLRKRSFGIFFVISFVITIALAFYYTFAGNFLADVGITNAASTQTIGQMMEIIFMLLLPLALRRYGMKTVLMVGMAAWAARYGLFSIANLGPWKFDRGHDVLTIGPLILVYLAVALHGVCFDFFLAAGFIYTDNNAPAEIRGSAQGLFSFLTYGLGMWIGNVLSGVVAGHFADAAGKAQWTPIWAVPAISAAVCLVVFLLLWKDDGAAAGGFEPVLLPAETVPLE